MHFILLFQMAEDQETTAFTQANMKKERELLISHRSMYDELQMEGFVLNNVICYQLLTDTLHFTLTTNHCTLNLRCLNFTVQAATMLEAPHTESCRIFLSLSLRKENFPRDHFSLSIINCMGWSFSMAVLLVVPARPFDPQSTCYYLYH